MRAIGNKVILTEIKEKPKKSVIIAVKEYVPRIMKAKVVSVGKQVVDVKVDDIVLADRAGMDEASGFHITKDHNILGILIDD